MNRADILPNWMTFGLGIGMAVAGLVDSDGLLALLGAGLAGVSLLGYRQNSETQERARTAELKMPLGPPIQGRREVPEGQKPLATYEIREGRTALIAFGVLIMFISFGALAKYEGGPGSLFGVPVFAIGAYTAFQAARKKICASDMGVTFVGFKTRSVEIDWASTKAIGRGLAREGSLFRDPILSAFAIDTTGQRHPLPIPLDEEKAFDWLARHAKEHGIETPPRVVHQKASGA